MMSVRGGPLPVADGRFGATVAVTPRGGGGAVVRMTGAARKIVATKIRLMRLGKIRAPYYRIVVADARTKREGRVIETIGKYHPKEDPSYIDVDAERVAHWLGVGAQPTEPVEAILKITGDWQRFKGLPEPEPMKTAAPRANKREVFAAAAREAAGVSGAEATTARSGGRRRGGQAEPARESTSQAPGQPGTDAAADRAAGSAAGSAAEKGTTEASAPAATASETAQEAGSGETAPTEQ